MIPLSPTEKEILFRFDRGESLKAIADELGISLNTVKTHARHIIVKTIANSMRHAAYLRRVEKQDRRK